MKCFNHPTVDAVAICKNCYKALCKECLVELDDGIACKNDCVEEVVYLNAKATRERLNSRIFNSYFPFLFIAGGVIMIYIGKTDSYVIVIFGTIFVLTGLVGIYNLIRKK